MACSNCNQPSLGALCVYCLGTRAKTPETFITAEQWAMHMRDAARLASNFLAEDRESKKKPGIQVLAHLLAAYALTNAFPALPSYEWYAATVLNGLSLDRCARCGILNPLMIDGVCQNPDCCSIQDQN